MLGNHLFGCEVTWTGAVFGLLEAGTVGCAVGALAAGLRNWALKAFAKIVRWRDGRDDRRHVLEKM